MSDIPKASPRSLVLRLAPVVLGAGAFLLTLWYLGAFDRGQPTQAQVPAQPAGKIASTWTGQRQALAEGMPPAPLHRPPPAAGVIPPHAPPPPEAPSDDAPDDTDSTPAEPVDPGNVPVDLRVRRDPTRAVLTAVLFNKSTKPLDLIITATNPEGLQSVVSVTLPDHTPTSLVDSGLVVEHGDVFTLHAPPYHDLVIRQ
jgi:hypothetical protein